MKRFLLIAMLFSALCAKAQTTIEEEQTAQIAELQEEVATLSAKSTKWDKIAAALPKLSGCVQFLYSGKVGDENNSTFQVRRVRLALDGDITSKLDYKLQAELASSVKLLDAYFSYKPFSALNVRAGQFKLPFSIINTNYGPTQLELIDYPMVISYLVGNNDVVNREMTNGKDSSNGRDTGIKLYGDLFNKIVSYDLGVFNGSGINVKDNNSAKDVVARLSIHPIDGLIISGSFRYSEGGTNYITRNRWAAGVCYDKGRWLARSEWIAGKTDAINSDGMYVTAGYRFFDDFMAIARYEQMCFNNDARKALTQENYTAGISWQPLKHFKLQVNYVYEDYIQGKGHNNIFQMQAAAMF